MKLHTLSTLQNMTQKYNTLDINYPHKILTNTNVFLCSLQKELRRHFLFLISDCLGKLVLVAIHN